MMLNWDDLRYFLELVRLKRMSQVARKLGVDRTTVVRRIELMEKALNCRLFESTSEGHALTEAGQNLLVHAENVENGVGLLCEEALGQNLDVNGSVRVGTPEGLGVLFVMPRLQKLLDEHPNLSIEILSLPRFANLASREADISVTLDPPQRGRYIATRLIDYRYRLFASPDYLARHGPINRVADLASHPLVGYIDELLFSPQLRYLDDLIAQPRVRIASSGMLAQMSAIQHGLGIGVLAQYMTSGTNLVPLLPAEAVWNRTFWLATHADWYKTHRIRTVWNYLRAIVEAEAGLFSGE